MRDRGGKLNRNFPIDLRRNDKMHINAGVKQKALLNGARYAPVSSIPGYKTDNWKLEIKSGIVAGNLE